MKAPQQRPYLRYGCHILIPVLAAIFQRYIMAQDLHPPASRGTAIIESLALFYTLAPLLGVLTAWEVSRFRLVLRQSRSIAITVRVAVRSAAHLPATTTVIALASMFALGATSTFQ